MDESNPWTSLVWRSPHWGTMAKPRSTTITKQQTTKQQTTTRTNNNIIRDWAENDSGAYDVHVFAV